MNSFLNNASRACRCFNNFCTVIAIPVFNLDSSVESSVSGLIMDADRHSDSTFSSVFLLRSEGEYPMSESTCPGVNLVKNFGVAEDSSPK